MKYEVIVLVGPPLSGKDTYLKQNDYYGYKVISRDEIVITLHGNNDYNEAYKSVDQKLVERILNREIQESIDNKQNVILNLTNLSKKTRNRHLSKFPNDIYNKVAVVFPKLSTEEYERRNQQRLLDQRKYISKRTLQEMIDRWEDVTLDEGFNTIIKL